MAAVAIANAGMVHMPASAGSALTSCRTLIAFLDEEDYALKNFALENIVRDPYRLFLSDAGFLFENSIPRFRQSIETGYTVLKASTSTTDFNGSNNELCIPCPMFRYSDKSQTGFAHGQLLGRGCGSHRNN
jgi:hypothetical protein